MADTDQVLNLAAIIREVDGTHSKGAAALAESILNHPRFRAVLAGGPAVPEGREPASAAGGPSDEELNRLLWYEFTTSTGHGERTDPIAFARAVLARWGNPAPPPPADGEVAELVTELQSMATDADKRCRFSNAERLSRAAELLQRQVVVPVSVNERLPGPEDCDSHGWCWVLYSGHSTWTLEPPYGQDGMPTGWTHWLAAHDLPLPEVGE